LTPPSPSHRTSEPSRNRILFLLSGEGTTIPAAEAAALARAQDQSADVEVQEDRIVIASGGVDAGKIASRVAFSKRVGSLIPDGKLNGDQLNLLRFGTYRVRVFELGQGRRDSDGLVSDIAERVGGRVSLEQPDLEVTIVRGTKDYIALSRPSLMRQDWSRRRPRARPFFHPAAIFPKLSRALVNLSRVGEGEVFLDPLCGTGSLLLEAGEIGAFPLGADRAEAMVRGALRNMSSFRQDWLGVVRADIGRTSILRADGIATDIPYGRASSTSGSSPEAIIAKLRETSAALLKRGKRLVVMHPDTLKVDGADDFAVEEEHHLYIHSKLTRTISVLRRL
jgi:tRNA (guanine10-N2)-dimethyltransferase